MRLPGYLILCFCWLLSLLTGCSGAEGKKQHHVIGLSQCMLNDAWRQAMVNDMRIEASNYDNVEIITKDAENNNETQIQQIRDLIRQKVDVLVISPYQSGPITAVAEEAYRSGIPTIITDRKVNTDLYTTFVGANNYEIGHAAGNYAINFLPENAVILEVWGLGNTSPAQERHQGFVDALLKRTDLVYRKVEGQWLYDTARVQLQRIEHPEEVDFVYSHNDMMAIAAREYFMACDSVHGRNLHIIGADAIAGAGLEAVEDGRINASFMYPTGSEQIVRAAMQIVKGETVDRFIPLRTAPVDKQSARTLLLQAGQLKNYKQRIEAQRSRIDGLSGRFYFLQSSLLVISLLMIGFIALSVYVFYINRKIKLTNRVLCETNRKEEEQRLKLISLNTEIKEVTAQKLQFFTNVSHEVRTPLTLILGPLERLISQMSDSPNLPELQLIQKNALRLYRVINQILDFRKVESKQEKLKICPIDIVSFTEEVKTYFDSMATVQHIGYTFTSEMKKQDLWVDPDKIEKVLVNLISNAFKFTPEGGRIGIHLSNKENQIRITVEDNGIGITPEKMPYLFDRFYTENCSVGTGIGLHLVGEYVRMHKGEVSVESIPGQQTVFTICLPKDETQLKDGSIADSPISVLAYDASNLDDSEERALVSQEYPYTILIVEDDDEMREFLEKELSANFRIWTAPNGRVALNILRNEEVSLVLSDVMMPEMNGFELCRAIKTDLAISHIPVVLLTALSDERQQMYGIAGGAAGYIQKPFHINFIKVRILRILEEYKHLREQLLQKLQASNLLMSEPEKVENMDDLFLRKFLIQIEKIYIDPEFNIEKLSDTLGLSRGHLHRKIKELTGTSPVDFLRNYRLGKAAQLLKQKKHTISEIAYQTGFSSPAYFSKCFKAVYEVTPTEFQ